MTFGPLALQNSYFEFKIDQAEAMNKVNEEFYQIAQDFYSISKREYSFFEKYKIKNAEKVLIIAGSATGTAKEVIDKLRKENERVGLIKLNLFRPFPQKEIGKVLKEIKKVAVFDRAMSMGTKPPFFMEIKNSLIKNSKIDIESYVYGLGGRDIFQKNFEEAFEDMSKKSNGKINYIT
jgi:pyruvate ferredoxin oxidoreductase alpha subunit